jgi:hypothetical protein
MSDQPKKKPWITPQLYRVELNPEQAILTACSLGTTSVADGGSGTCRIQSGGCKRHTSASGDAGPRPS